MESQGVSQPKPRAVHLVEFLGAIVLGIALLVLMSSLCLYFARYALADWIDGIRSYHNTAAVADLDNDSDPDLILHNLSVESEVTAWPQITLWTNQAGQRFTPMKLDLPPIPYLWAGAGDADNDGDNDLFILSSDHLIIEYNQGGVQGGEPGEFKTAGSIRPGNTGTPGSAVLGDLNNDGKLDGFVAGCCGMRLRFPSDNETYLPSISWVWINETDSDGFFRGHVVQLPELDELRVRAAALGDLDLDGDLDLFAGVLSPHPGHAGGPADRVLLNDGQGNFSDSGQRLGDSDSTSLALGDVDGDGDLDALVGTATGASLWINQGGLQGGQTGQFDRSSQQFAGRQTDFVFLSDFDSDGDLDALIGNTSQATLWRNDGQGLFERTSQRFRYTKRHALAVADFNDDGSPDILAAAYADDARLWLNNGRGAFHAGLRW